MIIIIHSDPKPNDSKEGDDYVVFDDLNHEHEDVKEKYKPQVHKRVKRAFEESKTVCYLHVRVSIEDIVSRY